jgi:hypothetical protein
MTASRRRPTREQSGKRCVVCGAYIPKRRLAMSFGRTLVCDHTCRNARVAGRTRDEQFRKEMEGMRWE